MIIGVVGFSLAVALIVTAVLLFIRWKIPAVLGELTGRTEKKQIEKMRKEKAEAVDRVNFRAQPYERDAAGQAQAGQQEQSRTEITDVLGNQDDNAGTAVLSEATDVLEVPDANATTILNVADDAAQQPERAAAGGVPFRMVKNVMVVHTGEVIE